MEWRIRPHEKGSLLGGEEGQHRASVSSGITCRRPFGTWHCKQVLERHIWALQVQYPSSFIDSPVKSLLCLDILAVITSGVTTMPSGVQRTYAGMT